MLSKPSSLLFRLRTLKNHLFWNQARRSITTIGTQLRKLDSGVCVIPHRDKRYKGGEDAN